MTPVLRLSCASVLGTLCRREMSYLAHSRSPQGQCCFGSAGASVMASWQLSAVPRRALTPCLAATNAKVKKCGQLMTPFRRQPWGVMQVAGGSSISASAKENGRGQGSSEPPSEASTATDEMTDFDEDISDEDDEYDSDFDEPMITTGDISWGVASLEVAHTVLAAPELMMDDEYGSPSLEDITSFSKAFGAELDKVLGEDLAGTLEVEVSSPGAERLLRLPVELERFRSLPLMVEYNLDNGEIDAQVLRLLEYDTAAELTTWGLADVALNKLGKKKGQGLNRKERDMVFSIPVSDIRIAKVHLDV